MVNQPQLNITARAALLLGSIGLMGGVLTTPALAHHAMGNQTPTRFIEGFLSGLAHPVIGLDHLAFVVVVGLLATTRSKGVMIPMAFVIAALVGTGLHLQRFDLPGAELWISASVLACGLLLALGSQLPAVALAGLASLAGLLHGYAYGESIIGATPAPLLAYLLGFTAMQIGIALGAFWLGQRGLGLGTSPIDPIAPNLRKAGWAIGGVGLALTYAQVFG